MHNSFYYFVLYLSGKILRGLTGRLLDSKWSGHEIMQYLKGNKLFGVQLHGSHESEIEQCVKNTVYS